MPVLKSDSFCCPILLLLHTLSCYSCYVPGSWIHPSFILLLSAALLSFTYFLLPFFWILLRKVLGGLFPADPSGSESRVQDGCNLPGYRTFNILISLLLFLCSLDLLVIRALLPAENPAGWQDSIAFLKILVADSMLQYFYQQSILHNPQYNPQFGLTALRERFDIGTLMQNPVTSGLRNSDPYGSSYSYLAALRGSDFERTCFDQCLSSRLVM